MANFWFKFEWDDWRNDRQLRRCCKETRGFWVDCIAEMEAQQTYFLEGTPDELCRDVVATREEFDRSIAELSRTGAANIEKSQGVVKILSRRLLKKVNLTEYNRIKQQEHRARIASSVGQGASSKDIESQSFRALDSPNGEVQKAARPDQKTLLPEDFKPTEEMLEWASSNCPSLDLDSETDEFRVFWRDIATKNNKRTTRGWNATWKNRMKERQERVSSRPGAVKPVSVGKSDYKPKDYKCTECFDTGKIHVDTPVETRVFEGQMDEVPCACQNV